MNPPPAHQTLPLVTERLRVRLWTEADRAAFRRMNADPRVMKFFPSTLSEAESDALLARIQAHQEEHGFTFWAVEDKNTGSLAGLTGLARVAFDAPFTPCVEIGWRFLPEYWGTGYALEAARSVMGYAFKVLKLPKSSPSPRKPTCRHRASCGGSGCSTIPPRISIIPPCRRITRSIAMCSTGC